MSSRTMPCDSGEFFVQIALENELMTPDQTQICLDRRKALLEEGDRGRMEDIAVALGIMSREQASLVTRGTNYLRTRQEDLLLAKAIQARGLASETDVQYALTLQDALYQHEDQAVPRLLELLQEDEVIGEDAVPKVREALEEIRESLRNGSRRVEDDPAVEYEFPQTDGEQPRTDDNTEAAASKETERAETGDESTDTDFMEETTGSSGRELATDPTMPLAGVLTEEPNAAPSAGSECSPDEDDRATAAKIKFTAPSNGKNGTAFGNHAGALPNRLVPLAPAPLRRQREDENGDTDEKEPPLSAEERLQAAVERRQSDMAPPPLKKKKSNVTIKRAHERFEVRDATIHFAGDSLFSSLDLFEKPSHIVNMSMGGLCMITRRPLAIGERIKMVLHVPALGDDLHAKGEVRSTTTVDKYTQHFRIGVKFLKLSNSVRQKIQRLVKDPTLRHKGKFRRYNRSEDF